ncbi:MAG: protein-methionine-sulfoxide reductase heme-binding subunit MsrQ [Longimicrobiales bacterium]|nr:protein-methionine-sulfoxide reductase heme-binding subunit MsrQ [Longimicrobiales bacterium]
MWGGALFPLGWLLRGMLVGGLGADPVETLLHQTGTWGLILLLVTLSVTPVRRITGWNRVVKLRRLLGLFSYFYATLHVGIYLVLDQSLAPSFILEDVIERPYVTAGAGAFLILSLLAWTSTRGWIRRLGRRWQRLHRLVYAAGALVVVHFLWQVKADAREALVFTTIYVALMLFRVPWSRLISGLKKTVHEDRGAPTPTPTSGR